MAAASRVLIFGHSFVRRLNESFHFADLCSSLVNVSLCVLGVGGTVPKLTLIYVAQQFSPHVIVLEIGSNDLCSPHINCDHLVSEIDNIIDHLFAILADLCFVVECEVIFRSNVP